MAFPTPEFVTNIVAAQANLATAKTAIDALSAGDPKIADQQLFKAVANLILALQNLPVVGGGEIAVQVPATPDVA